MKTFWKLIAILLYSCNLFAAEQVIDFSSRTDLASTTLVYNHALGVLHPTLQVMNYMGGFTPIFVDVGDGQHGVFDESTYSDFSLNGDVSGNRIQIDSNQYPILKVTNFNLAQGWTLEIVGDNPLVIYSLTDVSIAGKILCQGADGTDAVGATAGTGGAGRCGGGAGGDGGNISQDGSNGEDITPAVTGGVAGNFMGGAAVAGGGGGSWNTTSLAGSGANVNGGGGQGGTTSNDPVFATIAGGGGGGGGSGTVADAGAGGGGGGGSVIIHAARDFYLGELVGTQDYGFIRTDGGAGGNSNVPGGAGGGGAGGSIQVFAGRNIQIFNVDVAGASTANFGAGGSNSLVANGGNGGLGRGWFTTMTNTPTTGYNPPMLPGPATGYFTPAEEFSISPGNIEFITSTQVTESISYNLQNTKITFNSIVTDPISADFLVEVAGSDDDFLTDNTGWTTNLSLLSHKRYIKIRASITVSDVSNPMVMNSITVNYTLGDENNFDFTAASCGTIKAGPPKPAVLLLFLLPLLCLFSQSTKIDKQK